MPNATALAIAAHPDDIEFVMGGTLALLKSAGYETHYLNIAGGHCGSLEHDPDRLTAIREKEARAAAQILGARFHPSFGRDLEIFFEIDALRKLAAIVREVKPRILLAPSPQDYMEDHTNACRLAVTAAFARGLKNFVTRPKRPHISNDVTIYHAMPHGLRDPLRRRVVPGAFVNVSAVSDLKRRALSAHQSQYRWLDASQKMGSYVSVMESFSQEVGRLSGKFAHAEGWRRRLHYGFCAEDADPLADALKKDFFVNRDYEEDLERGCRLYQAN